MELVDNMDEPMDEILLSSVMEACVRIGKRDLLAAKLEVYRNSRLEINGSHTFGSLIKAHGNAWDLDGVWRCWKDMRNRHVTPTSITVGCMIEALVNNGDSEGHMIWCSRCRATASSLSMLSFIAPCSKASP